jgi:hypothetical protein
MERIVVLLVDPNQNPIIVPLLIVELETLTLFWAIYDTPTHPTSTPTWKLVVFYHI